MKSKKKNKNLLKSWFSRKISLSERLFCVDQHSGALELLRLLHAYSEEDGLQSVIAVPSAGEADQLCRELIIWGKAAGFEISPVIVPEGIWKGNPTAEDEAPRAEVLAMALSKQPPDIFIGSVHALLAPVPDKKDFRNSEIVIHKGESIEMAELAQKLVDMGYDDEPEAIAVGEFSRRGGIFDIFSPGMNNPVRLEFFGKEIDSMREYSAENGRSIREIDECRILIRSGTAVPPENGEYEDFSSYIPGRRLFIWQPQECMDNARKYGENDSPDRLVSFFGKYRECIRFLSEVEAADSGKPPMDRDCFGTIPQMQMAAADLSGKALVQLSRELALAYINQLLNAGNSIIFAAGKDSDRVHIEDWLRFNHLENEKKITIEDLAIPCGVIFPDLKTAYLTERELFSVPGTHKTSSHAAVIKEENPEVIQKQELEQMSDIEEGDFTVHLNYGLCRYHGIKAIKTGNDYIESLKLEFADDAFIYVPVWQAHLLSRYVGSKASVLKLSKLGGGRWLKSRSDAAAAARNLAAEMLRLQAIRNTAKGNAFQPDGTEQRIFDDAFPFEATSGQIRAIDEIKHDMESLKPMDRLLCGDVGYGKTEVAMRAAFKCVSCGRQVAVLVPTTVLAEQHYLSFTERFAEYPYTVDTLSRLKTGSERTHILAMLASGGIDIIIGTHALLSKDVRFRDLGLLIIDEEQRFGVEHKEKLKAIRSTVDILTMTATPIPRTLHMSISGLRDLSTITTAPTRRLPVHTVVMQYDSDLVGAALSREISRGGQVFYLHNRIGTIEQAAAKVRALLPEDVTVAIAHGQMPPAELESIMNDFIAGKIRVLVCTTIIESGIDIPNANTIIIERADHFGLAELHQLRGRVGRWNRQAYAYLLIPPSGVMTSDARRRMNVIRRYTQLGSGFKLALSDMEIRGAGNIIGAEQSGYVDAIGFHLYCQLLKEAGNSLRGISTPKLVSVELNLDFVAFAMQTGKDKIPASIPPDYIQEPRLRLEAYRRLAQFTTIAELDDFGVELTDRFGRMPVAAQNFLKTVRLRILTQLAGWSALSFREGKIFLERNGQIYRRNGMLPKIPEVFKPQEKLDMILYFIGEVLEENRKEKNKLIQKGS